jgi:enterochelin esterase-like enzyme
MKLFLILSLLFVIGCAQLPISQNPPDGTICGSLKYSLDWAYCITRPTDLNNKDVIYYFHGGGGRESDWIDPKNYTEVVRKIWNESGKTAPTVVAVSLGELWGFSDKIEAGKHMSSSQDFIQNVLPEIEKNILHFAPQKRIVLGESMGGFNASVIALRNPNLFSKIALVCPGVLREDLFSAKEVDDYRISTGAQKHFSSKITDLLHKNFDSPEQYKQSAPQALLKSFKSKKPPKLFLSCGESDEFGFYTESKNFIKIAQAKNFDVTWKPVQGAHCSMDINALAEFLLK